jgi:hypothetical protein
MPRDTVGIDGREMERDIKFVHLVGRCSKNRQKKNVRDIKFA